MKKTQRKTSQDKKVSTLERLQSGVPRLDYILKGGFIKGGIYTVLGPPGSGKTIFGNQLCFNTIHSNQGKCIYLTLMAESHGKLLTHLSTLEFFDPEVIDKDLYYISGYQQLKKEGLKGLFSLIKKLVKDHKANLLVIDGIMVAARFSTEEFRYDEFIHELQAYNHMLECTTILLSPSDRPKAFDDDNVIVDGVIEMSYHMQGPRAVRELTVHKFRGSNFLVGKHETEISSKGLVIHPRTEIQYDEPNDEAEENRERYEFGIPELDKMLNGGLMSGTSTVILGAPGTGKTLLGISFLVEGAKNGQKGVYFGFYEPTPRLIEKAENVGIPIKKYIKKGLIEIIWQPPLEHYQDSLAEQLLEKIKDDNNSIKRLFIDGVEGFRAAAIYPDRMPRFLSAFTNQLRMANVTSVITEELDLFKSEVDMPNPELATVTEGVIVVRYVELKSQIHRLISILKMRESLYDTSIREFLITEKGINVSESFQSAEEVLTGNSSLIAGKSGARRQK